MLAAVGASLESDEPSVVHGAVDQRGGHVLVAEHAPPAGELDVRGVDHAPGLVGIRYDLEQEPGTLLVDRHVAELVDDQEPRPGDLPELRVEPVLALRAAQQHEQPGRGEEPDRYRAHAREPAQRDREMGLAGADGPIEHEVLATVDEVERLELRAPPVGGHAQVRPVVSLDVLRVRESRGLEEPGAFRPFPGLDLRVEPAFHQVQLGGRRPFDGLGEHVPCQRQPSGRLHDPLASGDGVGPASACRVPAVRAVHRPASFPPSPVMNRSYPARSGPSSVMAPSSASRARRARVTSVDWIGYNVLDSPMRDE